MWVNDLAEAIFRLLQNPHSVKRVLDLGGPEVCTHMQFAADRARAYGGPQPFPVPGWLAWWSAAFAERLFPNPWFNGDMVSNHEFDQTARTKDMNPYIWTWDDIGFQPASIEQARERELAGETFKNI